MKVAIKNDIVLKNGKPNAAIIPYKELEILKRRKKEKSIPMDEFFKKLENSIHKFSNR